MCVTVVFDSPLEKMFLKKYKKFQRKLFVTKFFPNISIPKNDFKDKICWGKYFTKNI